MANQDTRTVPDLRGYVSTRVFDGIRVKQGKAKAAQVARTLCAVRQSEDDANARQPALRCA